MEEFGNVNSELIGVIAGTILVVAIAFRYLVNTVISLNQELHKALDERIESDEQRQLLLKKVTDLEFQVASLQSRLEEQHGEIQSLRTQILQRDQIIENLQTKINLI